MMLFYIREGLQVLVTLQITERCNFDCIYCFQGEKEEYSISLKEGKERIDFIFNSYRSVIEETEEPQDLTISFYGGEPLIEFSLMKALFAYAEDKATTEGILTKYIIISNGYLLSEEHLEFFGENRKKFDVKFSFDGQKEIHDRQRPTMNGQPTFDRVLTNIKRFQEQVKPTQLAMVITPESVQHFLDSIRFLVSEGFSNLEFEIDSYTQWSEESIGILHEVFEEAMEFYLDQLQSNQDFTLSLFDVWVRPLVYQSKDCLRCGAGRNSYFINVYGDIYACPVGNKLKPCYFGNVKTGFTSNVDIISNMEDEKIQSECLSCANKNKCFLTCIAQNYRLNQDIYQIHPIQCERGQLGVKMGIRFGNQLYKRYPDLFHKKFRLEKVLDCS